MKTGFWALSFIILAFAGCQTENDKLISDSADATLKGAVKTSKMLAGDPADVATPTTGGACLMGGSTDVDAAFQWMIAKSGGGDFVVIRADKSTGYNDYIYGLGLVNSVETVVIAKASDAANPEIEQKIRNAEALFIAGGDQKNYVTIWKDTPVEDAINYLVNVKKVPVGGTSAGCAILGSSYFAALEGTVTSADALADPYSPLVSLGHDDFLNLPYLQNTITDQHFSQRGREGRLMAFMARMNKDFGKNSRSIAVDEQTAVCIDETGKAKVFGLNNAFFLQQSNEGPEVCAPGLPLTWNRNQQAVKVYRIAGSSNGGGSFDLINYSKASGGTWFYFYVDSGMFYTH
jgi:cyanophycinase